MTRVKCSILDRSREKVFHTVATKGVVKFFNVCNQEQKDIEYKIKNIAGPSVRKRDKILGSIDKGSFLDKLKETSEMELESKEKSQPAWSVLRDDFVLGSKLKDWDKNGKDDQ